LNAQTFIHCSLYVCQIDSTTVNCQHGCSRKRRGVESEASTAEEEEYSTLVLSNRKRRDISSTHASEERKGLANSAPITFAHKPTCTNIECPSNAVCIDASPAYCRCKGNSVTDIHSSEPQTRCTDKNLAEMRVQSRLAWTVLYQGDQSRDFLVLARLYEEKMINYFVRENGLLGIRGMKIVSASRGFNRSVVVFRVVLALEEYSDMNIVSNKINMLLANEDDTAKKAQLDLHSTVTIVPLLSSTDITIETNLPETSKNNLLYLGLILAGLGTTALAIYIKLSTKVSGKKILGAQDVRSTKKTSDITHVA